MTSLFRAAAVAVVVAVSAAASAEYKVEPFFLQPLHVGAHRGGADLWPENTVYAYEQCAALGPNVLLEADVYTTADGALVVLHDRTVDRTTDGNGAVIDMTFEQVRALDAGYRFTRDGGATFPHRDKGLRIPTLAEALAAAPHHRFLIETKGGAEVVAKTIAAIEEAGAEDRVLLASFKPEHMQEAAERAPEIPRCYDMANGIKLLFAVRGKAWDAYTPEAHCLSLTDEMLERFKLTAEEVGRIAAKGIVPQIHTINDRAEMDRMLQYGFTSILSDDPVTLQSAVEAHRASLESR